MDAINQEFLVYSYCFDYNSTLLSIYHRVKEKLTLSLLQRLCKSEEEVSNDSFLAAEVSIRTPPLIHPLKSTPSRVLLHQRF